MADGGIALVVLDDRRVVREVLETCLSELGCRVLYSAPAAQGAPGASGSGADLLVSGTRATAGLAVVDLEDVDLHDTAEVQRRIRGAASGEEAPSTPPEVRTGADPLSPRERAVLTGVSAGLTAAQIAASLTVSERSVINAKRRIFAKLGVSSQAEAVSAYRLRTAGRVGA